jgi:hypothetical protein
VRIILYALIMSLSLSANADIEARRYGEGYAFRFVQDSVIHCWGMPDLADLNYFSPTWMKVTDTAQAYSWPQGDAELAAVCNENPTVKRTTGWANLMDITSSLQVTSVMRLPAGIVCGERFGANSFLYTVVYQNIRGFTICL